MHGKIFAYFKRENVNRKQKTCISAGSDLKNQNYFQYDERYRVDHTIPPFCFFVCPNRRTHQLLIRSRTTSPAMISPTAEGTNEMLPGAFSPSLKR